MGSSSTTGSCHRRRCRGKGRVPPAFFSDGGHPSPFFQPAASTTKMHLDDRLAFPAKDATIQAARRPSSLDLPRFGDVLFCRYQGQQPSCDGLCRTNPQQIPGKPSGLLFFSHPNAKKCYNANAEVGGYLPIPAFHPEARPQPLFGSRKGPSPHPIGKQPLPGLPFRLAYLMHGPRITFAEVLCANQTQRRVRS